MDTSLSLTLFYKIFGYIIPNDKNFNTDRFLKSFDTYFIAPLTGRTYVTEEREVYRIYTQFKKSFKFVSCEIEHDEFHKVYNCTFKFTKYGKVYQKLELNLRYDSSYVMTFYYHKKMETNLRYGGRVSLIHLYMKSNDYCHIIQEFSKDCPTHGEPESRYFIFNNVVYDSLNNEDFNDSSLLTFTNYDNNLKVKTIDYFCIGKYNFNMTLDSGVYVSKNYNFMGDRNNITNKLVNYLNHSGFHLSNLSDGDLLMCDAYHC